MSIVWDSVYPTCSCTNACGHSGANHLSYVPEYLAVIMQVQPRFVYEWGPGVNTYLALAAGATVVSVEHNPKWIPRLHAHSLTIDNIPMDDPAYFNACHCHPVADIYFVDSGHRERCLESVRERIDKRPASIVVLHDAQRERYHPHLAAFPYVRFLNKGLAVAGLTDNVLHFPRALP